MCRVTSVCEDVYNVQGQDQELEVTAPSVKVAMADLCV